MTEFHDPTGDPSAPTARITRRQVAKGAAWSVPIIGAAAAAPAMAASAPCTTQYYYVTYAPEFTVFSSVTTPITPSGSGRYLAPLPATWIYQNGVTTPASPVQNDWYYRASSLGLPSYGGLTAAPYDGPWLALNQKDSTSAAQNQEMRVTFNQPVYCVSFYVADIDSDLGQGQATYIDNVAVSGFTASSSSSRHGIKTTYTTNDTAYCTQPPATGAVNPDNPLGLAKFSYTGSAGITTFSLRFYSTGNGDKQQVWVSPIQFSTTTPCC